MRLACKVKALTPLTHSPQTLTLHPIPQALTPNPQSLNHLWLARLMSMSARQTSIRPLEAAQPGKLALLRWSLAGVGHGRGMPGAVTLRRLVREREREREREKSARARPSGMPCPERRRSVVW